MQGDQQRAYVKKFEARWFQEENIMQLVTDAWEHTAVATMHDWDREIPKAPHRRLKELKAELEQLRLGPLTDK